MFIYKIWIYMRENCAPAKDKTVCRCSGRVADLPTARLSGSARCNTPIKAYTPAQWRSVSHLVYSHIGTNVMLDWCTTENISVLVL